MLQVDQRYYNQAGRFFSPDPGGVRTADRSNPGSWNRYAYVNGDPVNLWDPSGTQACPAGDYCVIYNDDGAKDGAGGGGSAGAGGGGDCMEVVHDGPGGGSGDLGEVPDPGPTNQQILASAERLAMKWLANEDCKGLFGSFGSGFDPTSVMNSLASFGSYTSGTGSKIRLFSGDFQMTIFEGLTLPNVSWPLQGDALYFAVGADIFVNTGAISVFGGNAQAATTDYAEALIEELGHAYNLTPGSGGSQTVYDGWLAPSHQLGGVTMSASNYNSALVSQKCNK